MISLRKQRPMILHIKLDGKSNTVVAVRARFWSVDPGSGLIRGQKCHFTGYDHCNIYTHF